MTQGTDAESSAKTPVKEREWIEDLLARVPVVEWDRFVVGEFGNGDQYVSVYGWIDRDDDYKDFVVARFYVDIKEMEYTTSSDEYTEHLHTQWFGEDSLEDHNPCRRVEDAFDVENAVELHEDSNLGEYA